MSRIELRRVRSGDAADLIAANQANQHYHRPWVASLTDQAGFDAWFARTLTGPNVGLLARERASGRLVGVVNINEIVAGAFLSAYLGYYGMSGIPWQRHDGRGPARHGRAGVRRTRAASPGSERAARQYGIPRCCGAPGSARKGFRRAICGLTGSGATTSVGPCWPTTLRQLAQKGWPAGTGRRSAFARRQPTAARRRMKSSSSAAKPAGSSRLGRWPAPTNSRASAPGIVRAAWRERSCTCGKSRSPQATSVGAATSARRG